MVIAAGLMSRRKWAMRARQSIIGGELHMKRILITGIAGGVLGAVLFWVYQVNFQGTTITNFIGAQIVRQGGYSLPPAVFGWGVHLGVGLSYAFLLALISVYLLPRHFVLNRTLLLAAALVLGWLTTLIAAPAIQITISILAAKGFPAKLWPLNPASGHPLWNHLLFFVIVWAIDTGAAFYSKDDGGGELVAKAPGVSEQVARG